MQLIDWAALRGVCTVFTGKVVAGLGWMGNWLQRSSAGAAYRVNAGQSPDASGNFIFNYGADGPWDGDPDSEGFPESPVTLSLKIVDPDGADTGIPVDVTSSLKSGGIAVTIDAPVHDGGFTYILGHLEGTSTEVFKITVNDATGVWTTDRKSVV